jgi:hypothetical protein
MVLLMSNRLVPIPGNYDPDRAQRRRERDDESVFVKHPPVINHSREKWHHTVPYPYRFKWDGPWIFVVMLAAGGIVYHPLWILAGFIALMRAFVWICFRFPLTGWFLTGFLMGLLGGRSGRRY